MPDSDWCRSVIEYIHTEARPVDKFGHQPQIYALAHQIGDGLIFDDDVLFAAAWMHDLGVFVVHRPFDSAELARWDHVPYTIARTRELLPAWGFLPEKLGAVASAIATRRSARHCQGQTRNALPDVFNCDSHVAEGG